MSAVPSIKTPKDVGPHGMEEGSPVTSYYGKKLFVGLHSYAVSYQDHGPFVTLAFYNNEGESMSRTKVMLTAAQAQELIEELQSAVETANLGLR